MTELTPRAQKREPAVGCSPWLVVPPCPPGSLLLKVGDLGPCCLWHSPEPCTTTAASPPLAGISAPTSSNLSLQMCFGSLG